MSSLAIRAAAVVCFFGLLQPLHGQERQADPWVEGQLARIAAGDPVAAVAEALGGRGDAGYYDFMQALFKGEVYIDPEGGAYGGLVIGGDEVEDDYGEISLTLYAPYPTVEPLLDGAGRRRVMLMDDLEEVGGGRRVRVLVQAYLLRAELSHPDPKKRRVAAENMGNKGTAEVVPLLQKAIESESDSGVRDQMRLAHSKVVLHNGAVDERLRALDELEAVGSPAAIGFLDKVVSEDDDERVRARAAETLGHLKNLAFLYDVLQTIFFGLSLGSILVLMALGLAIVYGQMGVINMAHGEFMMIGAYVTFVVQNIWFYLVPAAWSDLFFVFALPCAFLLAGAAGWLIEYLVIRHLYSRPLESLLATWGISLMLVQAARSLFGDLTAVKMPQLLGGGWEIAPQVVLPYNRLFIIALTGAILGGLALFFSRTNFGLKIRAVTQNRDMSSCLGIPVRRVDALTFLIGAGIAGVAGWALTLIGNVVPNMGQTYIVDSFLVVVTGGVGKLMGTVSAGLGIGLVNKMLEPVFEAVYGKVIILGLIVAFLQLRPTGIFPARGRSED